MRPIFVAHGPAFKRGYVSEPFDLVDIYSLMCYILEVEPRLHDGNFDAIRHILVDEGLRGFPLSQNKWASLTACEYQKRNQIFITECTKSSLNES